MLYVESLAHSKVGREQLHSARGSRRGNNLMKNSFLVVGAERHNIRGPGGDNDAGSKCCETGAVLALVNHPDEEVAHVWGTELWETANTETPKSQNCKKMKATSSRTAFLSLRNSVNWRPGDDRHGSHLLRIHQDLSALLTEEHLVGAGLESYSADSVGTIMRRGDRESFSQILDNLARGELRVSFRNEQRSLKGIPKCPSNHIV